MLHLSAYQRYFLYPGDTNMRKSFDSLSGMVSSLMKHNVLSGDIFIFVNRRRNHIKLLHWEGDGFALYHKRLEKGTYELPVSNPATSSVTLSYSALLLMLQGITLTSVTRRKRYHHNPASV
ncbi:MAG: IS66 family insertion sequence element accessory protein TnpB [Williamsia sp.]|nr:IS66 family insertion sequence element accessory protein TnpB [Williamsia sp.]